MARKVVFISTVSLVAFGLFLYVAWRRGRLWTAFLAVTVVIASLWGLAQAAISTDYRDADGLTDCWPGCTPFQEGVGVVYFYGPFAIVALALFAAVLQFATRRRTSRRQDGNPPSQQEGP